MSERGRTIKHFVGAAVCSLCVCGGGGWGQIRLLGRQAPWPLPPEVSYIV